DTKQDNIPVTVPVGGGIENCLPAVCVGIFDFDTELQQISQELRLNYEGDSVRGLLGGYFFDENYNEYDYTRFIGSQSWVTETRAGIPARPSSLETNTYSIFGS